jgi:hypothetical protein
MTDVHLDSLLDELVAAEPRERWNDVRSRARRSRRRYATVVATLAVLVLTPATWAAVDAFEGTPAPPDVSTSFTRLNSLANRAIQQGIAGRWPEADASKARGVIEIQTADGPEDIWSAPSNQGGRCYFIDWANDPPEQDGTKYGFGGCPPSPPPASKISWGDVWIVGHPALMTISGTVDADATTVQVALGGGSTLTLPVVEHLFLGSAPKDTQVDKVTAFDADGNVVASSTKP